MMIDDDKMIRNYFAKDNIISKDANKIFDDTLNQLHKDSSYKKTYTKIKSWMTVAACACIVFVGANSYARAKGYNNVFFMIKEVFEEDKQESKDDIFYDRDITISYQSFNITEDIEMQINELQITKDKAKLFLYVKENKESEIVPFKYKVYNDDLTKTYEGISSRKEETSYKEILELKNYNENQSKLILQVYSNENVLLKTITIDLEDKTLEARSEIAEVRKISQIKLNEFLAKETRIANEEDNDKQIIILKITDISYGNEIYLVKYLYSEVTEEEIENSNVEEAEIKEGLVKFKLIQDDFELIEISSVRIRTSIIQL